MKYSLTAYILCLLALVGELLTSCELKKKKEVAPTIPLSKQVSYTKPAIASLDTLFIQGHAAIFFDMDSIQEQQLKKMIPDMEFKSMRHDCFYQMRNARTVIRQYWKDVKIIEAKSARWLCITRRNQITSYIDLNTTRDICGIYLFNGQKDPQLIDMMNVETALEYYFRH